MAVTPLLVVLPLAGCLPHVQSRGAPSPATTQIVVSPGPTVTVLKSAHTLLAGQTAAFDAQAGVSLRLTASRPKVSTTRLSSSYGYPPARGHYLTFTLTIVNTGSETVQIGPSNFVVRITGEGRVTSVEGNAPYSGASAQLVATALDPGQRLRTPITFDVRHTHGTLAFLPDRSAAVIWRF